MKSILKLGEEHHYTSCQPVCDSMGKLALVQPVQHSTHSSRNAPEFSDADVELMISKLKVHNELCQRVIEEKIDMLKEALAARREEQYHTEGEVKANFSDLPGGSHFWCEGIKNIKLSDGYKNPHSGEPHNAVHLQDGTWAFFAPDVQVEVCYDE